MNFLKSIQRGMQGVRKFPNDSFQPIQPFQQQAFYSHLISTKRFPQRINRLQKAPQLFSLFSTSDNSGRKEKVIKDSDRPEYTYQHYIKDRHNKILKSKPLGLVITIDINAGRFLGANSKNGEFINYREIYAYSESLEELIYKGIVKARMIEPVDEIHEQHILDPETIPYALRNELVIEGEGHQFEYNYNIRKEEEIINLNKHTGVFASIDRNAAYELDSVLQCLEMRNSEHDSGSNNRYYKGSYKEAIEDGTIQGHKIEALDDVISSRDIFDPKIIPYYYKNKLFSEAWEDTPMQPIRVCGVNFFPSGRKAENPDQGKVQEPFSPKP